MKRKWRTIKIKDDKMLMRRNKGQVTLLAGLALVAVVFIAGGFTLGNLQQVLKMVINNWITLFVSVLGISVAATFVINSYQKNPNWKMDIAGLGIMVGLMFAIFLIPTASGMVTTYTGKFKVTIHQPYLGEASLTNVDILEDEFSKTGLGAIAQENFNELIIIPKDYTVKWKISCEDSIRDQGQVSLTPNVITHAATAKPVMKNLPQGKACDLNLELIKKKDGKKVDSKTKSFQVPTGDIK